MERYAGGEFRRLKVSAFSLDHIFDDDVAREFEKISKNQMSKGNEKLPKYDHRDCQSLSNRDLKYN